MTDNRELFPLEMALKTGEISKTFTIHFESIKFFIFLINENIDKIYYDSGEENEGIEIVRNLYSSNMISEDVDI